MPDSSPQTSQPLLQEFLNLLREKKYSENSLQSHRLDLQKYLDWLGDGGEVRLEQLQVLKPADILPSPGASGIFLQCHTSFVHETEGPAHPVFHGQ